MTGVHAKTWTQDAKAGKPCQDHWTKSLGAENIYIYMWAQHLANQINNGSNILSNLYIPKLKDIELSSGFCFLKIKKKTKQNKTCWFYHVH
jgi:hypothetical protein